MYTCQTGKSILLDFFHQVIAETFIPNPNNYPFVNHKDENPSNNCVENLEWCTKYYNDNYGTARERANKSISIPIVQLNLDGSFVKEWQSATKAEEAGFGCATIINRCIKKKLKSHYGYLWLYSDEYNKMSKEELNEYIKWTETITYKKDKRVVQLNMDDKLIKVWDSAKDAAKDNDFCASTISAVCKHKNGRTQHKGYKWMYLSDYERIK